MKYWRSVTLTIIVAVVVVLAFFYLVGGLHHAAPQPNSNTPRSSLSKQSTTSLDHIFIIVEENKPIGSIIGNAYAPFTNKLIKESALATNYFAITHPSLPNYIAMTSGTTAGITTDCIPSACQANVKNITDRLEQAGKTWKEYAESMPAPCYAANSGTYAVRHNPFMYYPSVTNNKDFCSSHIVPLSQLNKDLQSTTSLPNYSFITPDVCSDMHNCSISAGDNWLSELVPRVLGSPAFTQQKSLLVITWDEGDKSSNNVLTIFAGPAAKRGYVSSQHYTHYSLLRTIEDNWQLRPLTSNDASVPAMTDMLR